MRFERKSTSVELLTSFSGSVCSAISFERLKVASEECTVPREDEALDGAFILASEVKPVFAKTNLHEQYRCPGL